MRKWAIAKGKAMGMTYDDSVSETYTCLAEGLLNGRKIDAENNIYSETWNRAKDLNENAFGFGYGGEAPYLYSNKCSFDVEVYDFPNSGEVGETSIQEGVYYMIIYYRI